MTPKVNFGGVYQLNNIYRLVLCLCLLFLNNTKVLAQETKHLKIPKIKQDLANKDAVYISDILTQRCAEQEIALTNWPEFSYRPKVSFCIAHDGEAIWLRYDVEEEYILAQRTETNSATHRDSCVEFFIDLEGDGNYYNFEFNAIGTVHLAYGPNIGQRTFIKPRLIEQTITTWSSLGRNPIPLEGGGHVWSLLVRIDKSVFSHSPEISLNGLAATANFYKCADDTPVPYYLSWNPVSFERPNFHLSSSFGDLNFE